MNFFSRVSFCICLLWKNVYHKNYIIIYPVFLNRNFFNIDNRSLKIYVYFWLFLNRIAVVLWFNVIIYTHLFSIKKIHSHKDKTGSCFIVMKLTVDSITSNIWSPYTFGSIFFYTKYKHVYLINYIIIYIKHNIISFFHL